jgi:hypothetical protein
MKLEREQFNSMSHRVLDEVFSHQTIGRVSDVHATTIRPRAIPGSTSANGSGLRPIEAIGSLQSIPLTAPVRERA